MPLDTAWWTVQWNNSLQLFYGQSYVEMNWHYWERAQTYQKDANKNFYLLNSNWIWANYFMAWAKRPFSMIGKKHTHPFSRKSFPFTAWQDLPGLNSIISLLSAFYKLQVFMDILCTHSKIQERRDALFRVHRLEESSDQLLAPCLAFHLKILHISNNYSISCKI